MLKDTNTNNIFYALATEIINNKKLYNYLFSEEIINLFLNTPTFYMLINKNTKYPYKMPDVAYKSVNTEMSNYYFIFGNEKEKVFENCDEYYFFNKSFSIPIINTSLIRYALFTGNKIYYENNDLLELNDYEINEMLKNDKYKTIIISYDNSKINLYDILVLNYKNFIPLTILYH